MLRWKKLLESSTWRALGKQTDQIREAAIHCPFKILLHKVRYIVIIKTGYCKILYNWSNHLAWVHVLMKKIQCCFGLLGHQLRSCQHLVWQSHLCNKALMNKFGLESAKALFIQEWNLEKPCQYSHGSKTCTNQDTLTEGIVN